VGSAVAQDAEYAAYHSIDRFRGEELYYGLEFFGTTMARGALVLDDEYTTTEGGVQALQAYGLAMTEGLAAMLYPLRDEGSSLIVPSTGLPITSTKELREQGQYRRYDVTYLHDQFKSDITRSATAPRPITSASCPATPTMRSRGSTRCANRT
jgi:hypothetical protein